MVGLNWLYLTIIMLLHDVIIKDKKHPCNIFLFVEEIMDGKLQNAFCFNEDFLLMHCYITSRSLKCMFWYNFQGLL